MQKGGTTVYDMSKIKNSSSGEDSALGQTTALQKGIRELGPSEKGAFRNVKKKDTFGNKSAVKIEAISLATCWAVEQRSASEFS